MYLKKNKDKKNIGGAIVKYSSYIAAWTKKK
jgi:hypothetical protein